MLRDPLVLLDFHIASLTFWQFKTEGCIWVEQPANIIQRDRFLQRTCFREKRNFGIIPTILPVAHYLIHTPDVRCRNIWKKETVVVWMNNPSDQIHTKEPAVLPPAVVSVIIRIIIITTTITTTNNNNNTAVISSSNHTTTTTQNVSRRVSFAPIIITTNNITTTNQYYEHVLG